MSISPAEFVREFQRRAGLVEDAIPGKRPMAALDEVYPPPPPFDRAAFAVDGAPIHLTIRMRYML